MYETKWMNDFYKSLEKEKLAMLFALPFRKIRIVNEYVGDLYFPSVHWSEKLI